ncbi:hypothetical protein C4580_02040 [Candidatus Woesearchaeota archaeon]|nr:MAG: hypothetical protein C4580_02040 [Candidatus Woesearchaeota archaeon]
MGHFYSHSSLKLLDDCESCFYKKIVHGIDRPSYPTASITYGIDDRVADLFEKHRSAGTRPPHLAPINADLWPADDALAQARKGIRWKGNLGNTLYGRLDQIVLRLGKAEALDLKTRKGAPNEKQVQEYHARYTTQLNVYNYLLEKIGLAVGDSAHLLVLWPTEATDTSLAYETQLITIPTSRKYMNKLLTRAVELAGGPEPKPSPDCDWCSDRRAAVRAYRRAQQEEKAKPLKEPAPSQTECQTTPSPPSDESSKKSTSKSSPPEPSAPSSGSLFPQLDL